MKNVFKKELWLIVISFICATINGRGQSSQAYRFEDNNNLYVRLPAGFSRSDVVGGDQQRKKQLYSYTESLLADILPNDPAMKDLDLIITFMDENGISILPDAERTQIQGHAAARVQSNEITYTFNSTAVPWSAAQLIVLNTWVNDIYPAIKKVVGNPFFNITVNVTYNPNITNGGLYYRSADEMVLRDLLPDVFCHESIHAFRDDYTMGYATYEEGMTRAGEIEVFNQLAAYPHPFDEFHGYSYDVYYELLNRPNIGTRDGLVSSNPTLVSLKYHISSYVWAKLYLEDNNFFKRFNDSLYDRTVASLSTQSNEPALRSIVQTIKPYAEGLPIGMWYPRQYILDIAPTPGYKLYQRASDYIVDYFFRTSLGGEQAQSDMPVSYKILDNTDAMIVSGTKMTSGYGWIDLQPVFGNYIGRIKIIASVQSPTGLITDTVLRSNQYTASGVFGIVEGVNTGTVSVTPMDTSLGTYAATVTNGAFSIPFLQQVRGRFRVEFSYPDCNRYTRVFTKDRSDYFISIKKQAYTYWVGSVDSTWDNRRNWSGGFVPDHCTDVIILAGTKFNCVIRSAAFCRKLELNSAAILINRSNLVIGMQ